MVNQMTKYEIKELHADGYERFAFVREMGKDIQMCVHFIEYDEYIENGEASRKRKKGDLLEGNISIELVTHSRKVDAELSYHQNIQGSSHIEAIVEVTQVKDSDSFYARSSLSEDDILIEFENAVNYRAGEKVFVIGSLEFILE